MKNSWNLRGLRVFRQIPTFHWISLKALIRLRVLEQKLPAERAWDWLREESSLERVLQDIESSPDGGAEFPKVWECFSVVHSPPAGPDQETNKRDLPEEARRVINLLIKLPDETISKAIKGISYWLSVWEKYIVAVPNWSVILGSVLGHWLLRRQMQCNYRMKNLNLS